MSKLRVSLFVVWVFFVFLHLVVLANPRRRRNNGKTETRLRSRIVPPLIEVLKCGSSEAQEDTYSVLFNLALDDDNKTTIRVLGALSSLLHMLQSESKRTRHDSALALYHLSLVQSNRAKMVMLDSVPVLLD